MARRRRKLASYRDIRAFRDDPGRETVGATETTSALVHLRRPSRLSTLGTGRHAAVRRPGRPVRVQPQRRPARLSAPRATYQAAGRIHGRADTEVGARWLEDAWHDGEPVDHLLGTLHDTFGGHANLAVLAADGRAWHYSGNDENRVFTFRLGESSSPRPASIRSIGRSSGSPHPAPPTVASSRFGRRRRSDPPLGRTMKHAGDWGVFRGTADAVRLREVGAMHGPSSGPVAAAGRPTTDLSLRELLELNSYWLAINILWGALGISLLPILMVDLVCGGNEVCADPTPIFGGLTVGKGIAEAIIVNLGVIVAILVQPTVASISDHWSSRFGRRKPFIFIGTLFDMVFLVGLYFAGAWIGILLFYVLLQFSSNFAQGPFQGYMPDLVPARQVGLASGLMGLMILLGAGGGAMLVALINATTGNPRLVVVAMMVIELVTMLITVTRVRDGRQGIPREGRSWLRIARGAWATDILAERSYLWMLGSRLFLLMATATLTSIAFFFMQDAFGLSRRERPRVHVPRWRPRHRLRCHRHRAIGSGLQPVRAQADDLPRRRDRVRRDGCTGDVANRRRRPCSRSCRSASVAASSWPSTGPS